MTTATTSIGWTPTDDPYAPGTPTSDLVDAIDTATWDAIDAMWNLPDGTDFNTVFIDTLTTAGIHLAPTDATLANNLRAFHDELADTGAPTEHLAAIQTAARIAAPHQPTLTITAPDTLPDGPVAVATWIFAHSLDIYDNDPANDPDDTLSFIDHAAACNHKPVATNPELAATLAAINDPLRRTNLLSSAITLANPTT